MIPVHEPSLGEAEAEALRRCVSDGDASGNSPTVERFERAFADRFGAAHALAVSSGSTALHLAFAALGIGPGDEVIVPSFTFAPCADMVNLTGARPVLVDGDEHTFDLTADIVGAALTTATKAVLAVHLYGRPCELTTLRAACDRAGVALVEDCAQGLGAMHAGRPVGSFGAIACYSFYANKLITTGEGGMVTTDDPELAERLRFLRNHAQLNDPDRPYVHVEVGFNYRMPAFAAAVGSAQVGRCDEFLARKAANADRYTAALAPVAGISVPAPTRPGDRHANWAYAIVVDRSVIHGGAAGLQHHLRACGVQTRGFYHPLHLHPGSGERSIVRGSLPNCERFAPNGLVLPSGNTLRADDVDTVIGAVRAHGA